MWKYLSSHKKLITLLLVIMGLGGWYLLSRQSAPSYTEYQVESKDIAETIELSGKISAGRQATLRFAAGGLISYLGAQEGDTVKKYQTLASVDTRQLQKVLEQKLNLYAIQRDTFEQTIDDNDNSIPDGDLARELDRLLKKNQYQLDNVVKDVEYQDLSIRLSRLSAPFDGILVSAPHAVSGVNALATESWVVVDPTSLEFLADLDEIDLSRVHEGQKVKIKLDAFPDLVIDSTIATISYSPKETTSGTTYEVKIPLPESAYSNLRMGLNGTAEIILEEKFAVPTLPTQAVVYKGGKVEVLMKEGNSYTAKNIELGTESTNYLEIKSGLSTGDKVYVKKAQ